MDATVDRHRSAVVVAFAADLRRLRDEAGAPSYRRLAAETHFAPSTMAEALRGVRLPTEAVVRALAGALDADPDLWAAHLRAAVAEIRRGPPSAAVALVGAGLPADAATTDGSGTVVVPLVPVGPAVPDGSRRPGRVGRRLGRVGVAAALAGLVAGAAAFGIEVGRSRTPAPAPAASTPAVTAAPPPADGADPIAAGCDRDARVLGAADLRGDDATRGRLEIRWSLRCGAVWAQLQRAVAPWPARTDAQVTLTTSDGRSASYTVPMVPLTTVMFRLGQFCATAQAVAHDPDFRGQATATVPCVTP